MSSLAFSIHRPSFPRRHHLRRTQKIRIKTCSSSSTTIHPSSSSLELLSRKSARRQEKALSDSYPSTSSISSNLSWETFDFSHSPKWDSRFQGNTHMDDDDDANTTRIHSIASSKNLEYDLEKSMERQDSKTDEELQAELDRKHKLWQDLDPQSIQAATDILLPFVQPERVARIQSVLQQRTRHVRFLFENPANPSNVWACLRTLDSFGIQYVDVVIQSSQYQKGKSALIQKRGLRVAMGSAKWLTIKTHLTTKSALETIKKEGYYIVCTDVNTASNDVRRVDWDASNKPMCIVMGNEERGVSDEVKAMADEAFYLPMVGFAESFNLSAATAITCAHLSACSNRQGQGPIRPGDLPEQEYRTLLFRGYLNSINPKTARALFRRAGLVLPKDLNLS